MFDISFSELMLIGVIALIVIGPQKLPKVARTVGHLLGRAQRYVNDVKTDIRKEMDATEIGNLKDQMQEAAQSVKASVDDMGKTFTAPLDEAQDAFKQASDSVKSLADSASKLDDTPPAADTQQNADKAPATEAASAKAAPEASTDPDLHSDETIDTLTLPLPGFEHGPVAQHHVPAEAPNANKEGQA